MGSSSKKKKEKAKDFQVWSAGLRPQSSVEDVVVAL